MDEEDLAKYPGLHTRENGIWYVRKRVPLDLKHVDPRFQVRLSLDTADRRTAIQRYPLKLAEITVGFEKKRAELQERGAVAAALARGRLEDLGRVEIEQLVAKWWTGRKACRAPVIEAGDDYSEIVTALEADAARAPEDAVPLADRLLVEAGMAAYPHKVGQMQSAALYPAVDRNTFAYRTLLNLVTRALRIEAEVARDHLRGSVDAPYDPIFNPKGARSKNGVSSSVSRTVGDLIFAYRHERQTLLGKESTERKYGLLFRVLEEVLGADLPLASITRAKCIEVLDFLKKLPPNATKRFPKLTLSEAAAEAQRQGLTGLAPQTVASYMQGLNAILAWAKLGGWGVDVHTKGLIPARKAQVRRRGFKPDELKTLFAGLAEFRAVEPTKFWVPALALYTGARAGEICQLHAGDVQKIDEVWCIDLSEFDEEGRRVEGKRLKTEGSERYIPVHPHLVDAGFLTFVQKGRGGRLFPDLEPGPSGNYSHDFSKWFGRTKKRLGFKEPALVFHSFRHGFRDACREANIADETSLALGGWAGANQAARYGNRGSVAVLHRAVQKITFGSFRLPVQTSEVAEGVPPEASADILQPVATAAE